MVIQDKRENWTVRLSLSILCCIAAMLATGCTTGHNIVGGGTPTPTPTTPRMLVSDNSSGAVNVVNATTDVITKTVAVLSPGKMVSAGGTTLIQSTIASSVAIFDNATETIRFTVPLSGLPLDVAITPDGKTGFVAVNDGTVQKINTATGVISGNFSVAGVQRLAMGPQGTTVLAFNDTLANNFAVILTIGFSTLGNATLDHPTNAFFTTDDNNFFVLDCGSECAGTQAGIAGVTLNAPGGPSIGTPIPLSGATIALRTPASFFAAGSPATGLNAGTVQVINSATLTAGAAIHIADGRHSVMALTSNAHLYIGSTGCTLGAVNAQSFRQGCLTIFDTGTQAVTPVLFPASRPNGDVTALAPVAGRNVIYVVQGGKLDILDITTNAVSPAPPNPPGTVFGVVQLSP